MAQSKVKGSKKTMCQWVRDKDTWSAVGQGINGRCIQEAVTRNDDSLQVTLYVTDISLFSAWSSFLV